MTRALRYVSLGRRVLARAAVAVLLASLPIDAQDVAASLSGIVVAAESPATPIRRAYVTVTRLDSTSRLSVGTDEQGRFTFPRLPAGRYMVSASKPAYLTTTLGSGRIGRTGTPLVLEPGQQVTDVRLALARGGVLSGTVRDMTGAPAANLEVLVASAGTSASAGLVMPRALLESGDPLQLLTVLTDDRGGYRVYGLPPGEYVIAALPGSESAPRVADATTSTTTGGAGPGARNADAALRPHYSYAPTFYPGTPRADEAARVRVGAGEEQSGLDFFFDLVPMATVGGSVSGADVRPGASLSLMAIGPPLPLSSAMPRGAKATADGRFEFSNVRPGRYVLRAQGAAENVGEVWAQTEVVVNGADVHGLSLVLQPTMRFSGRVHLDPPGTIPPPVRVVMRPANARGRAAAITASLSGPVLAFVGGATSPRPATTNAGGFFSIPGILPGIFDLTISPPADLGGWWLESAVAGGRELLDMPLEFGTALGSIDDAVLTLTNRRTELTGRLQTPAGLPATDYSVIVFSADRAHWFAGARRTRAVRPATDGVFSVTELPAGAYLVAAVTDAYPDDWQRASFLEQLATFAVPVTVRAGETKRQDLQMAAGN